jgi:hypothetical protein
MSNKKLTSVRLRSGQVDAIEEIVQQSRLSEQIEDLNKAETIRRLIDEGLDHSDLSDLVDESTRILAEREDFIETQGQVKNLRTGFEARVKRHFKKRFEQGTTPEQIEQWSENMIRDARILWPEWAEEDYSDRRQEAVQYVEDMCHSTIEAVEESSHDPLDPDRVYDQYRGVEDGQEQAAIETQREDIIEALQKEIANRRDGPSLSPCKIPKHEAENIRYRKAEALSWQVSEQYDVDESRVEELLDDAVEQWDQLTEVEEVKADD